MTDAFVLGGVRTPVGRYGGSLSHLRIDDLLGQTMVAACERAGVPIERIEDITAGPATAFSVCASGRARESRSYWRTREDGRPISATN
jgi:acetyl-CoA acetyltransferase